MLSAATHAVCHLWLAGYAGKSHAACCLCIAAGRLGTFMVLLSVELDHRWEGQCPIVWQTLGDVGDYLRTIPPRFGLPVPNLLDF